MGCSTPFDRLFCHLLGQFATVNSSPVFQKSYTANRVLEEKEEGHKTGRHLAHRQL